MKLSTLLLTTPMASAWSLSRFDPFYTPTMSLIRPTVFFPSAGQLLRDQRDWVNQASREITQTSPRYELTDNDREFKIAIEVPGMTSKDISISLEDGFLSIKGTRESSSENYRFTSKFSQCFSIDPTVEVDKFAANLENGVLVISAPKDVKKIEERVRTIPILEAGAAKGDEAKIEISEGEQPIAVETKEHKEQEKEVMDLDAVKG